MMTQKLSRFASPAFKTSNVKRLVAFVVCAMLAMLLVVPGAAFAAKGSDDAKASKTGTYVFDERGLFTQDEFDNLEAKATDLANKYGMGVYFLTTGTMGGISDPSSSQRTSYATTYYKNHELGLNKTDKPYGDGIMFVIAADSRDYVTIAYGQGSYSFSDKGIEVMEDAVKSELKDNDWYEAAEEYYDIIGNQLKYYAEHGKAKVPLGLFGYLIRIAIVLGIPLLITSIIIRKWRSEMLTAVEQSEADNYLDRGSVTVTKSNDTFIRTSLIATPRPKNNSSSGGGWGGGGGGGFSSSGGGKF